MNETTESYRSAVFFDQRDHALLHIVTGMLARDKARLQEQQRFFHYLHPRGIKEMAESKGLRIAYAVIHLLESLEKGQMERRLAALKALRDEVMCSDTQEMRHNTARILIEIMKEMVRARGSYLRQIELAHDFRIAASGKPRVVRAFLRHYHLLEMPEEWNQVAFDDHVHDANTKGRKSPTHLIMDAWIKGIRRLRVIYYNYIRPETARELLEAADIMGITVRIGIEFSASFNNRFVNIIWVPRGFASPTDFLRFLAKSDVKGLMEDGREVSAYEEAYVFAILDAFNRSHRPELNENLGVDLPPLDLGAFRAFVGSGQASLLHLAKFIHARLYPLMLARVEAMREEHDRESEPSRQKEIRRAIIDMNRLDSENLYEQYLRPDKNPGIPDVNSVRESGMPALMRLSPRELIQRLVGLHSGYRITLNLSHLKVEDVLEILYDCGGRITRLEIFNLKDYVAGKVDQIPLIDELQNCLNRGNVIRLKRLIMDMIGVMETRGDNDRVRNLRQILGDIETLKNLYVVTPLKSRLGTDSTGHSPRLHGMGLAVVDTLPLRSQRVVHKHKQSGRLVIPFYMDTELQLTYSRRPSRSDRASMSVQFFRRLPGLNYLGFQKRTDWVAREDSTRMVDPGNIVTLGGQERWAGNRFRMEPELPAKDRFHYSWRYLRTGLKNSLKVLIGFIPAFLTFFYTHHWWVLVYGGAFIWFGITGLRNIIQSVMGGGGFRRSPMLHWNNYVSWERLTDSLMYTGFSVPLLDYLVKTLLLDRGFDINTTTSPVLLYTIMALFNGVYLTSHNLFRGLPKEAAYANFFRSVVSIPVAFGLNTVIGLVITLCGVQNSRVILQSWAAIISKTASDFVAGVIEGVVDRARNIDNRLDDYQRKLDQFSSIYARLEMLFPETDVSDLLDRPAEWFAAAGEEARDNIKILIINALDMLYFWMYQPRARTAFRQVLCAMPDEERRVFIKTQQILTMQREISLMFIEGIAGRNFSRPLSFFLDRSEEYLAAIESITGDLNCSQADFKPVEING